MRLSGTRLRRWLVAVVVALIAFELLYVVAATVMLRGDTLARLINKKPEKTRIEWTAARTWLPGVVTVEDFRITGQTRKIQWYLEADRVRARISLLRLPLKQVRVRGIRTSGVDFRLRHRLDAVKADGEPPSVLRHAEHFPEIPGLTNPPDPSPEDLYPPRAKKKKGWTIDLGGIDAEGPVRVAVDRILVEGEGTVAGGITYKLRDSIRIRRADLHLGSTRLVIDSELASDDLTLEASTRWRRFPAKGAKPAEIFGGLSGAVAIAGDVHASVPFELVPGLPISGTGRLDASLRLDDGVLQDGTSISLDSDSFRVGILGLTAAGAASMHGVTTSASGGPLTELTIDFNSFQFLDPADDSVGIEGSDLGVDAAWSGLSVARPVEATTVVIDLREASIRDIGVLGQLVPSQEKLTFDSGAATVSGRLAVDETRTATGTVTIEARQFQLTAGGTPLQADLTLSASLERGELRARSFELGESRLRVDHLTDRNSKTDGKLEDWWSEVDVERGKVTIGQPLDAQAAISIRMADTRPLVALINDVADPPGWLSLLPNIENVEGTMTVDLGAESMAVEEVAITGDKLELLGWLQAPRGERPDGRLFASYGILSVGIALDGGKTDLKITRPREWFDTQERPAR